MTALFSDGVANRLLSSRPCHVDTQDTITLAVQWRNRNGSAKLTKTYLGPDKTILGSAGVGMQAGVAGGGGVPHRGEVDEEAFHGEGASPASKRKRAAPTPPASTALPRAQQPTGSLHSPGGFVHTLDAADGFEGGSVHTLDAVHGFEGGSVGHATYTSSWIAPRSDVHSQQRWFYMGQAGERRLLPPPRSTSCYLYAHAAACGLEGARFSPARFVFIGSGSAVIYLWTGVV